MSAQPRILVVDDEPLARLRLREQLSELALGEVVGEAGDGRAAVELALAEAADVVLMDIAMPVMDGLEAARHLARVERPPAVVFCTAYDEHALAAFDAAAVDYLVKPVRRERLAQALERAARYLAGQAARPALPAAHAPRTHLSARLRGSVRLIPVEDIRYLQADEKYVVVHHGRGEDLVEDSLRALELEFGERFLRIHRNCLVAAREVAELRRGPEGQAEVVVRGSGERLEVSRRCLAGVRERLRQL
jgi:two-component system response regulator AlgR